MEQVKIKIGPVTFDHADSAVLYLPEGHVPRYAPGTQTIVGLTVLGARRLLDRHGNLTVTIPEPIQASADDLAPALAAV